MCLNARMGWGPRLNTGGALSTLIHSEKTTQNKYKGLNSTEEYLFQSIGSLKFLGKGVRRRPQKGKQFSGLRGRDALFDDDLLPSGSDVGVGGQRVGAESGRSGGIGQPVGRDVLLVGLADDLEGPDVGVRDVGDGVAVNSGLVGDGADLLHRQFWGPRFRKEAIKGLVVAEGHKSAGALGGRG